VGSWPAAVLNVRIQEFNPDVNVCVDEGDLTISWMVIFAQPKKPGGELTANQNVNLKDWDVTPVRVDGGTVTSPVYHYEQGVFVEARGSANLVDYRLYPAEYLRVAPFNYLFPENGGFDPETGADSIRENLSLVISGRTVSGKQISTPSVPFGVRFYCN